MGFFNTLILDIECPNCGEKNEARIQFKYGKTWQLKYKLGDTIIWSGKDIGSPNLTNVKAYGIIESTVCTFCGKPDIPEEYDIFIVNNVIRSISPIESMQDYLVGDGEYVCLDGENK
jgi:hypothetical protein